MTFDASEPFNKIADAVRKDGDTPEHKELALTAELYGTAWSAVFDCYKKAWFGDSSANNNSKGRANGGGAGGGGGDPFSKTVFACLEKMTKQEMDKMQKELDHCLQKDIFPEQKKNPKRPKA